jgi:hypothetical protein
VQPTAEYILRLLADLYADQCGVNVTVKISERSGKENEDQHFSEKNARTATA